MCLTARNAWRGAFNQMWKPIFVYYMTFHASSEDNRSFPHVPTYLSYSFTLVLIFVLFLILVSQHLFFFLNCQNLFHFAKPSIKVIVKGSN